MKIAQSLFVTIEFTLRLDDGEIIDETPPDEPFSFVVGGGQIPPGLEKGLEGMEAGEKKEIVVAPDDGFGAYDERLQRPLPRENFPDDVELEIGAAFQAEGPHGDPVPFRVVSVEDDEVLVDFNHPLAGKTLHFDVTIIEVREATEEERKLAEESYNHCTGCHHDDDDDEGHHGGCHSGGCSGCAN